MQEVVKKLILLINLSKNNEISDAVLQERITKLLNEFKQDIMKDVKELISKRL